jgi:hypothetical protein
MPSLKDPNGRTMCKEHIKESDEYWRQFRIKHEEKGKNLFDDKKDEIIRNEEEWEKTKPKWTVDEQKERNLKALSNNELENLMEIMESFIKWMEPEMKENNSEEIDFNRLYVKLECEDFIECKGISQQKLEDGYYYFKKKNI